MFLGTGGDRSRMTAASNTANHRTSAAPNTQIYPGRPDFAGLDLQNAVIRYQFIEDIPYVD